MSDFSNKAEEFGGKAKEAAGEAVGNEDLRDEGRGDQAKSKIKEGVENIKDKATEALGKLTGDDE
ncbi:CsbD family protein [Corynebacterium sphenisci]|uniref:CsbD family protein n=1 Tax=Corynebacterium sphenisci TaxID=191493 RepID=UPI0026DFE7D7|nr:CsbD family protein [Corynebacterium sphenisci]MDO5730408.1 CsbD family protein [Corynebacterium sphenisci]